MKKRKLLVSGLLTMTAVGAGVAPSVITTTNTQHSIIDKEESIVDNPSDNMNNIPSDSNVDNNHNDDNQSNSDVDDGNANQIIAYAPQNDVFTYEINFTTLKNDVNLDKILKDLFADKGILNDKKYLLNAKEYKNVDISYVENSAKFDEKSFELLATPVNDAEWNIAVKDKRIIKVQIGNLNSLETDSSSPSEAIMTNKIGDWSISDNKDLENLIVDNFDKIDFQTNSSTAESFSNVSIEYVSNSANISNKEFKIKVSPFAGHAWSNGSGISSKEITVKIQNLTWYGNFALAPIYWTVNSTISSDLSVKVGRSYRESNFYLLFGVDASKNEWCKEQLYNIAIKDFQKLFPINSYYSSYTFAKWDSAIVYKEGVRFFFRTYVQPKGGLTWYNGTTTLKEVQFNFYLTSKNLAGDNALSNVTDLSKLSSIVDQNYDENGLPNQWISSFGVTATLKYNQEGINYFSNQIKFELSECYQPLYNFNITDVQVKGGNWTYTVNFLDKHTGKIIKSIPGYVFMPR